MLAIRKPTSSNCLNSSASVVGQPAGGVASQVPGFFRTLCRGLLGPVQTRARISQAYPDRELQFLSVTS